MVLAQAILKVEQKKEQRLFETPRTVSWERGEQQAAQYFLRFNRSDGKREKTFFLKHYKTITHGPRCPA